MRTLLIIIGITILGFIFHEVFGQRDPVWAVELSETDAVTLSASILAHANTRGCGDIVVDRQYPSQFRIDIICNAERVHRLTYKPSFSVDGRHASFTWLEEVYCLKESEGKWKVAFLRFSDARDAAIEFSKEHDESVEIFNSSGPYVYKTEQDEAGQWRIDSVKFREATHDERRGCELTELR